MSVTEVQFQAAAVEAVPEQAIQGRSQWQLTWRRLLHDRMAIASMIVIGIRVLIAVFAPVIASLVGHGPEQVCWRASRCLPSCSASC